MAPWRDGHVLIVWHIRLCLGDGRHVGASCVFVQSLSCACFRVVFVANACLCYGHPVSPWYAVPVVVQLDAAPQSCIARWCRFQIAHQISSRRHVGQYSVCASFPPWYGYLLHLSVLLGHFVHENTGFRGRFMECWLIFCNTVNFSNLCRKTDSQEIFSNLQAPFQKRIADLHLSQFFSFFEKTLVLGACRLDRRFHHRKISKKDVHMHKSFRKRCLQHQK